MAQLLGYSELLIEISEWEGMIQRGVKKTQTGNDKGDVLRALVLPCVPPALFCPSSPFLPLPLFLPSNPRELLWTYEPPHFKILAAQGSLQVLHQPASNPLAQCIVVT